MNLAFLNRGYNYGMINRIERGPFSELGDQQLLEQTRRLAANQRCLEVHILDHLDEIDRRGLALRRGFSSLFDYTIIGPICKCCNVLLVTPKYRYCFRNPLIVSDHPKCGFVWRREAAVPRSDGSIERLPFSKQGKGLACLRILPIRHCREPAAATQSRHGGSDVAKGIISE